MSIRTYFENIAAAIKEKNPNVVAVTPAQMPDAILNISGGVNVYELTTPPSDSFGNNGDYAIVDTEEKYATNSGSNWIDLGIKGNEIFGFSLKAKFVSAYNNYYLAGSDDDHFCVGKAQGGAENVEYFIRGVRSPIIANTGVFTIRTSNGKVYINDVEQSFTYDPALSFSTAANDFSLYSIRGSRTVRADIYNAILYDANGDEIINVLPVLHENVACFYDSVGGGYYYPNSGTLTLNVDGGKNLYEKINGHWEVII